MLLNRQAIAAVTLATSTVLTSSGAHGSGMPTKHPTFPDVKFTIDPANKCKYEPNASKRTVNAEGWIQVVRSGAGAVDIEIVDEANTIIAPGIAINGRGEAWFKVQRPANNGLAVKKSYGPRGKIAGAPVACEPQGLFVDHPQTNSRRFCPTTHPAHSEWQIPDQIPAGTYRLHRDGELKWPPGEFNAREIGFAFPDVSEDAIVRVDVIDSSDNTWQETLACGDLPGSREAVFSIPGLSQFVTGRGGKPSLLLVRVFDVPGKMLTGPARHDEESRAKAAAGAAAKDLVAKIAPTERSAVHGLASVRMLWASLRDLLINPNAANVTRATAAAVNAGRQLSALSKDWCDEKAKSPLAPVVCSELQKVLTTVGKISVALTGIKTSGSPSDLDVARALRDAKLGDVVSDIAPSFEPEPKDVCEQSIPQLRWLKSEDENELRLISRARVPLVGSNDLIPIHYGSDTNQDRSAAIGRRLGFLVVDAPSSTEVSFAVRRGNLASTDVPTLLTTFLANTTQAVSKGTSIVFRQELGTGPSAPSEEPPPNGRLPARIPRANW